MIVISRQQVPSALDVHCSTMDITPVFNQVLAKHHAPPVEPYVFRVEALDEFLKEAYRIVRQIARDKPPSRES